MTPEPPFDSTSRDDSDPHRGPGRPFEVERSLEPGERLQYRGSDRRGGELVVTDSRVIVSDADDDEPIAVPLSNVAELTYRSIDWFLFVLGGAIVIFGALSLERQLLGGIAFLLAGLVSLVVTWRRRGRVRLHTHSRPKPVTVYPADPTAFVSAVDDALAPLRAERPPDRDSHGIT